MRIQLPPSGIFKKHKAFIIPGQDRWRQSKSRRGYERMKFLPIISASVFLTLGVIAGGGLLLAQNVYLKVAQWYLRIGSVFSFLGILLLGCSGYILYAWDKRFKKSSYAIVVPHTRDEYRRNEFEPEISAPCLDCSYYCSDYRGYLNSR